MTSNSNVLAKLTAIAVLVGALAVMALFAVGPYARIGWVEDEIEKNNLELLRLRKQLARETGQQKDDHGVAGGNLTRNYCLVAIRRESRERICRV